MQICDILIIYNCLNLVKNYNNTSNECVLCIGANYNHSGTFSVFYQFIVIKVREGGKISHLNTGRASGFGRAETGFTTLDKLT